MMQYSRYKWLITGSRCEIGKKINNCWSSLLSSSLLVYVSVVVAEAFSSSLSLFTYIKMWMKRSDALRCDRSHLVSVTRLDSLKCRSWSKEMESGFLFCGFVFVSGCVCVYVRVSERVYAIAINGILRLPCSSFTLCYTSCSCTKPLFHFFRSEYDHF